MIHRVCTARAHCRQDWSDVGRCDEEFKDRSRVASAANVYLDRQHSRGVRAVAVGRLRRRVARARVERGGHIGPNGSKAATEVGTGGYYESKWEINRKESFSLNLFDTINIPGKPRSLDTFSGRNIDNADGVRLVGPCIDCADKIPLNVPDDLYHSLSRELDVELFAVL